MSPAAVSGKNGRKLVHKLSKNVMKSYRFRIPKYDMPIRLRPVSITPLSHCLHLTRSPVVPRLHMRRYGRSRIAWFHEPRPAVERQAIALSMFLPCYRRVLFYHRRGRVSSRLLCINWRSYSQNYFNLQGCSKDLVLAPLWAHLYRFHLFLLWWSSERSYSVPSSSSVPFQPPFLPLANLFSF